MVLKDLFKEDREFNQGAAAHDPSQLLLAQVLPVFWLLLRVPSSSLFQNILRIHMPVA